MLFSGLIVNVFLVLLSWMAETGHRMPEVRNLNFSGESWFFGIVNYPLNLLQPENINKLHRLLTLFDMTDWCKKLTTIMFFELEKTVNLHAQKFS